MLSREVELMNQEAIKDGLLLPDGQSFRIDYTKRLGQELTPNELNCYLLIHNSPSPISINEIYPEIYKLRVTGEGDRDTARMLISRVKSKLGEMSVICLFGLGYVSRRALIERGRLSP